ncbi:MAG TPA: enoyl-CoA hydratase/isomerase family protein [Acidimicrobiales bacterium]|nr:enoyl-CoA hydratase/isomerase family protein [Acidimicrobiales bacterium]
MRGPERPDNLGTVLLDVAEHVATVTLNRPELLNAFDVQMQDEVASVWQYLRHDDDVRAIVLTGAGDKAFCVGIDRADIPLDAEFDPYTYEDPGKKLGPKSQGLWKPVVAAVNGMACGGAFYLLAECDIVVSAAHATYFDPHVTYGMTASYEPILLAGRMAFGDLVRMTLLGAHERMSAETARAAGLVSEVVPASEVLEAADRLATTIASQPPASVQASLRSLWAARSLSYEQALGLGNVLLQLGTSSHALRQGQESFASEQRASWRLR